MREGFVIALCVVGVFFSLTGAVGIVRMPDVYTRIQCPEPYERFEPSRLGMRVSLITLGAGCVAFGALPGLFVEHVAAPAASILLHPGSYATGVLSGTAGVPRLDVTFSYGNVSDLALAAAELVLGIALAVWYLRVREPRPVAMLRRLHTGSVNEYAAFAAGGIVIVSAVLLV